MDEQQQKQPNACDAGTSCPMCQPGNRKLMLVLLAILVGYAAYSIFFRQHPLQGKPAPSFSLSLLDGGTLNLADHLGKRPILLDFWAIWCPPCRAGLPKLSEASDAFKDEDILICAVNLGDKPESVAAFVKDQGISTPVALDTAGAAASAYGVSSIPMLVFIDSAGIVRHVKLGALEKDALTTLLRSLL